MSDLTDKQQVFVNEYLQCWNATEAARRAGYAHPNKQGPRLLVDVGIAAIISQRVAEQTMTADEALVSMSDMARANIGDFINVAGGIPIIDFEKAVKAGKLGMLKKITYGKGTISFELYDKQRAIETIGKHHGLWKDGVQININVDVIADFIAVMKDIGENPEDVLRRLMDAGLQKQRTLIVSGDTHAG